ncbi:MAG: PAS domain S-box protein [Polyangiales bacterium]
MDELGHRPHAPRTGVSLTASTNVPALLLGVDGAVLMANAAAEALLGVPAEQLTAHDVAALVRPETAKIERERLVLALTTRTVFVGDVFLAHASSRPMRCRVTVVPVSGDPPQLLALLEDRTSRLFDANPQRFEEWSGLDLLDRLPAGVVVHAPDTHIVYANAYAAEALGISYDRLVGIGSADPRWEFIDSAGTPLDVGQYPVVRALTTGEPVQRLLIGSRRLVDGHLRWGLCDAIPLRDSAGALRAVVVCFVDVTDMRRAEIAHREADERLRLVLEATNDALWDMDLRSGATFCSARFWEMLGFADGERRADEATWISLMHPEDRDAALADIRGALLGDADTYEREFRMLRKDGRDVLVLSRGRILRDAAGAAVRVAGTNTDITERRAFEERMHQSQKLESIGQLAGGVAHDFNNLLAVIRGNLELLEAPGTSPEAITELAREAQEAAQRGADLTRRLLAFARQQPLHLASVDVEARLTRYLRVLRRIIPESVTLETALDPDLPAIRGDGSLFDAAVLNLAINARDAMPDGGALTITARAVDAPSTAAPDAPTRTTWVEITVRDTGVGMSREVVARAVEPFFTTKAQGRGSGLGLSMVYGFVRQCGGAVEIESEPGRGTAIRLLFPTAARTSSADLAPPRAEVTLRNEQVVLVVEDDHAVRRMCVRELASMGFRALEAEDGPSALTLHAQVSRVDVLISDVIMPGGMNGVEVAAALTARQPDLRVIYMSGYHADVLADFIRDASVPVLAKPFSLEQLRATLARVQRRAP